MPTPASAFDTRLLATQVEIQAGVDRESRWVETLFGVAMAAFFYWRTGSPLAWTWLALRAGTHLIGTSLSRRYFADDARAQHPARWMLRFTMFSALESVVWATGAWMLPPPGDVALHAVMAVIITIATSTAIYATQAWPVVVAWILPMNLGLLAALLWQRDAALLFMAVGAATNLGLVLHFGRMQQRLMAEALVARFEKESLAERLAEQVEVAQRASDAKTRFLAAASHDLRQPMHAITLFGAVLERGLQDHPMHANATRLMSAVDALSSSFGAMLDVSRLDAGAITPAIAATPLNPVLRQLSQTFATAAEHAGLQLRLRATPLWVHSDPQLLQRLLANLVENALKYTPRGGVLVVARARGDKVWIEVCDTGIGIDPIHQSAVFQEFYQVDNPGRDRSRGLGIGLSIVQRLGDLLGHEVQLHSRPGRGTRFRIVAPAAAPVPETPARVVAEVGAASASVPPLRLPRLVLLVDDEDDIASAMQAVMQAHGVRLLRAANAAQARSLCAQARADGHPVEALISDLRLAEGADGLALALELRTRHRGPDGPLPTLVVTGETTPGPIQRVRASGLPVLFKPVTADALLQALVNLGPAAPAAHR